MIAIRHLRISNFRGINHLLWTPGPGINCIIGPGDSCKSSVISAIDLVLTARRSISFNDSDFHNMNVNQPIAIEATIGNLPNEFLELERYGSFLRGFNPISKQIFDEPDNNILETVVTIRLIVNQDLQPEWGLYSVRAEQEQLERNLTWKQREAISPIKLDDYSDRHLAWGKYSLLNKLMGDTPDVAGTLASIARQSRGNFQPQPANVFDPALTRVRDIARRQGISVGELKAQLDIKGVSLSNGAIALHDSNDTPLKQLGTGSTRLLVSGIQRETSNAAIMLVDEAELGLEPFRISRLLTELGAIEQTPTKQVFMTSHSPHVVKELKPEQLFILRKHIIPQPPPNTNILSIVHSIYPIPSEGQSKLIVRNCTEALFANKVIVCEGVTEIGLLNGYDRYKASRGQTSNQERGAVCVNGAGDHMFERAKLFKQLGFPTAIFKDSDKNDEQLTQMQEARRLNIDIFEWDGGLATENALFQSCPLTACSALLSIASDRKSEITINNHITQMSQNSLTYQGCFGAFNDSMRVPLGTISKKSNWYKDLETAERIGAEVVGPNFDQTGMPFQQVFAQLESWVS